MPEKTKYANLDGLRGLAALIVVLWHYSQNFLPSLNGWKSPHHIPLQHTIASTPLHVILGGQFSVSVFFVLSGFVLSLSFFKSESRDVLVSAAARRYFRLMLPALGSVLVAAILVTAGLMHHQASLQLTDGPLWIAQYWNYPANFLNAAYQGTIGAFTDTGNGYNPVLWTMKLELFGSFLVFAFLALFGRVHRRWIIYAVVALLTLKSFYFCFIAGVAISDLWIHREHIKNYFTPAVSTVLLGLGLLLGGYYVGGTSGVYSPIKFMSFSQNEIGTLFHSLGAIALVLAVLSLPWLSKFLESRPLQFLGRISFSLYLLHLIILGSFSSILFGLLLPHASYGVSFVIMFAVSMSFTLAMAVLYTRYIDVPSIAFSKKAGNWLLSRNKPHPVQETDGYAKPRPGRRTYPAAD